VVLDIILQLVLVVLDIILQLVLVVLQVVLDIILRVGQVNMTDLRSTQGAASLLLQLMRLSTKFTLMSAKLVVVRSALHLWQF
jgi:hypothetical protein